MLHDPHSYSEPMEFRPERFLVLEDKQPEQDPHTICFGFGRRLVGCEINACHAPIFIYFQHLSRLVHLLRTKSFEYHAGWQVYNLLMLQYGC